MFFFVVVGLLGWGVSGDRSIARSLDRSIARKAFFFRVRTPPSHTHKRTPTKLKNPAGFDDKTAYAQCIFAFSRGPDDPDPPRVFVGRTNGRVVAARGPNAFGWDPVFEPSGFAETYAEMDKDVKNGISHRYRALDKLRAFLKEEYGGGGAGGGGGTEVGDGA